MPLESTTYINGLNASNPTGADTKAEGDDHIRLIKSAVKATFPNLTGAVTADQTELNVLDGATLSTAELNVLDGATLSTAELNLLDGVTASTTEINYIDGVTSPIQTQIDGKASKSGDTYTGTHNFTGGTINVATAAPGATGSAAASIDYANSLAFSTALPALAGNALKTLRVNAGATSAEWALGLPDVTGHEGDQLSVNGSGGVEWKRVQSLNVGSILQTCETLSAPDWLLANGSAYLKSSYPALSALIGKFEDGGATWSAGTDPSPNPASLCGSPLEYLNGLWLLGGYTGSTSEIRTSSDGIAFTQRTSGPSASGTWQGFAYGASLFVACEYSGAVKTSPDGTTWTSRTSNMTNATGVAFNGTNLFIVAGAGATNKAATSPDGITWTGRGTAMATGSFKSIAYGAGLFVGITDATPAEIKTTTDGITWTGRTNPLTGAGVMVRWVNGEFWMTSSTNKIARSSDGITWTEVTNPLGANVVYSVTYGNGRHVIAGANTTSLAVSDDNGANWATRSSGFAGVAIAGAASNGSKFVICGASKVSYNTPYSYDTTTQFVTPNISATAPTISYVKA